jgi:alpha-glucosidase
VLQLPAKKSGEASLLLRRVAASETGVIEAQTKVPLVLIDWGWTDILDLGEPNPDIDLAAIVKAAGRRGIGVVVWASWQAVLKAKDRIFSELQRLGVKGVKIDFIDRDDQLAVASVYEIARLAAEHELMVNYHGIYKPTGIQRTYPNVINFEGVKGLENEKWADEDAPRNAVIVPYIRMLAGPIDYTPGAMRNAAEGQFAAINNAPMSKGTRVHQLAMDVVYEAPMQMLCDSPSRYLEAPESLDFISRIPTVFDETVPLLGQVGEYVAIARRAGDTWYIGAMTNWTPRRLELDLSFLGEGSWTALMAEDGANAAKEGTDHRILSRDLEGADTLTIQLAPAGGWAAILSPSRS